MTVSFCNPFCILKEGLLSELALTAYDVQKYLREALPALRAAIYRGDLSQAKDVLTLYDDTVYDEYELSQALVENDYSWVFSEDASDPEAADPQGTLVGLVYPLILAYHHPELLHVGLRASGLEKILPLNPQSANGNSLPIQPGFREGLRAMWEIIGFLTPEATVELRDYCRKIIDQRQNSDNVLRHLQQIIDDLGQVVALGYGLVIERE
jgi:hypothetical protein